MGHPGMSTALVMQDGVIVYFIIHTCVRHVQFKLYLYTCLKLSINVS